ncbi:protein SCO1/2 [Azonexus fungiphilus]|uniref:Protein SCO1/2 n=1 Tax=Azonexus fungiphilus TaxID=146940 RepID=A0A495WMM6_9RHOO|nr:SCO family protein [Azonexus fungiphilus]NHC07856.1 SCO family protein [Azonexus fungiphilus]RKT62972.1 protein SCO1/2 [Azonexus fungiphilus]
MKRRSFIGLAAALALAACGKGEPRLNHPDLQAANVVPTANLFDGQGRPRNFEEFRGKAVIVFFGYTSCPDICPAALRKYASLIRNLRDKEAERVQLVFISIDPERDTPERADTYAKWFNPQFLGLSGTEEQIAEVARQFKVVYSKKNVEGGMNYVVDHSTDAYLIDPRGQLRLAIPEAALIEPIAADLRQLLGEP